jgi:hypothetical protein
MNQGELMLLPVNGESSTYGMKVDSPIIVTDLQIRVMKVLHSDPQLTNRLIAERVGSTRSAVQTSIVDLYYRAGVKTRGELVAMSSLMVYKDRRGGNNHPMAQAHKMGLAFPDGTR